MGSNIVSHIVNQLQEPRALINRIIGSEYAFAIWCLPGTQQYEINIDLGLQRNASLNLEYLPPCFVINSFSHSHPTKPKYIHADISYNSENLNESFQIDPQVSSTELDIFLKAVTATSLKSESIKYSNDYENIVASAVQALQKTELNKVVLSRFKDIAIPSNFEVFDFFELLIQEYPNAFKYVCYSPEYGLWIGASPEKLININMDTNVFSTDALAGTQPLLNHSLNSVGWTMKEIEEQAMVSRYIVDCFKKIRLREFEEVGPKTVKAGNLAHLLTQFSVDMNSTNSPELGSVMLDLLHPTSAVCGYPRKEALNFINNNEDYDRELYAGFIGPVNQKNQTSIFVNLRCMQIFSNKIRLYAGAGITSDSIPEKEFAETEHKMDTLLSLLQK